MISVNMFIGNCYIVYIYIHNSRGCQRTQYAPPIPSFLHEASFGLRVLSSPVSLCVYQSLACPHDNSSPVQARITKFGQEKQNTLVQIPIVIGSG